MKKFGMAISSILLTIGIMTACQVNEDAPAEPNAPNEQAETSDPAEEKGAEREERETDEEEKSERGGDEREKEAPAEKELTVTIEGNEEKRSAHLQRSDLNYSLYVLDGYTWTAEEPGRDVVYFNNDEHFFVRIEPLGDEASPDEIKAIILEHAEGDIQENHPVPLPQAEYALLEKVEFAGQRTVIIHTAKYIDEALFKFTLFIPSKEAAEGTEPSFWAMLKTIERHR